MWAIFWNICWRVASGDVEKEEGKKEKGEGKRASNCIVAPFVGVAIAQGYRTFLSTTNAST
jgi:hypothetical protein